MKVTTESTTTSITISWEVDPNIHRLDIYLDDTLRTTVPPVAGSYNFNGLTPSTRYTVQVFGFINEKRIAVFDDKIVTSK